ncbi:MAG: phasin family protein [Candidatus Wenzhouxiangella sp. M2_3B_020]
MTSKNQTAFDEIRKAQEIMMDAFDKTARANLATAEKMLELNKQSFATVDDYSSPADLVARQSSAFKEYADEINQQFETLASIGNESREQLTELGQEFARNVDVGSFFNFAQPGAKSKPKAKSTKAA